MSEGTDEQKNSSSNQSEQEGLQLKSGAIDSSEFKGNRSLLRDQVIYTLEFLRNFQSTGTLFSSSSYAAKEMTRPLIDSFSSQASVRILEVGPGTGVITRRILELMKPKDSLSVCELNPLFLSELKRNLEGNPNYRRNIDRVEFFEGSVIDFPKTEPYDLIICAIPFLNLGMELIKKVFEHFSELGHERTELTYYEYIAMRDISKMLPIGSRRERIREYEEFNKILFSNQLISRRKVWLNMTPIYVYRLYAQARGES